MARWRGAKPWRAATFAWAQGLPLAVPAELAELAGDRASLALQVLAGAAVAQLPPITASISPRRDLIFINLFAEK